MSICSADIYGFFKLNEYLDEVTSNIFNILSRSSNFDSRNAALDQVNFYLSSTGTPIIREKPIRPWLSWEYEPENMCLAVKNTKGLFDAAEEIKYILDNILIPRRYVLHGAAFCFDENEQIGTLIVIKRNKVHEIEDYPNLKYIAGGYEGITAYMRLEQNLDDRDPEYFNVFDEHVDDYREYVEGEYMTVMNSEE